MFKENTKKVMKGKIITVLVNIKFQIKSLITNKSRKVKRFTNF